VVVLVSSEVSEALGTGSTVTTLVLTTYDSEGAGVWVFNQYVVPFSTTNLGIPLEVATSLYVRLSPDGYGVSWTLVMTRMVVSVMVATC
jgi:hypothetical protein